VKASKDSSVHSKMPFELSTIDLYSSRSRQWFAKVCADIFGASEELIKEDLGKLMTLAESYRPKDKKVNIIEATKEEKDESERFLKNPAIFTEILTDLETIGVTGEETNKLANEVLGQSLDELAKPSRTLLSLIYQMVKEHTEKGKLSLDDFFFNRRMIREYINWTDWQIKAHIRQLEEMEYLHVRMGAQGKQYCYALNYKGQGEENGKCFLNLTPVEEIRKLIGSEKVQVKSAETQH